MTAPKMIPPRSSGLSLPPGPARPHQGAAHARNMGALHSRGSVLFFIDADCLVQRDTLARVEQAALLAGPDAVIGGTYTAHARVIRIFSAVSSPPSSAISRPNGRRLRIISRAMQWSSHAKTFRKSGGFPESFLPIIEDVHFSHNLRKAGYRLMMDPGDRGDAHLQFLAQTVAQERLPEVLLLDRSIPWRTRTSSPIPALPRANSR